MLLSFGFANLAALGWLAAAAAPILIHLWMRQTHRTTPWAAYQFLKSALERQARRLRLQHWILLAIRTAILLLVALAAAKPFFESKLLTGGNVPTHRLLVIDNSLSMGFAESGKSRFDRSIDSASGLIKQSLSDDKFTILTASNLSEGITYPVGLDKLAAIKVIKEISLSPCKSDIQYTLQTLESMLAKQDRTSPLPTRAEVVFFTDLLSSDWQTFEENAITENDQTLSNVTNVAQVRLVDVGSPSSANQAITSFECTNRLPTTNQELEFLVRVMSYGQKEEKTLNAELIVDGISVDQQRGTVIDRSIEFVFSAQFESPGPHTVTVKINNDSLLADNERHLAINLKDSLRILCIEGRPRAARYVADALNPAQDESSPLQPEIISHADLSSIDLNLFDCVIFCNVPDFSENEKLQIKQFCQTGGGAIFFLGDQVISDRYEGIFDNDSQQLSQHSKTKISQVSFNANERVSSKPLLPVSLQNLIRVSSSRIDPLDYRHPILAPFEGNEQAGLLSTPISIIHSLGLASDSDNCETRIAMATVSGDPLLLTSRYGAGRVAVFATDGSLQSTNPDTGEPWTAMPAWPSFLPLIHGTIQSVLNLENQIGSHEVGQLIHAPPVNAYSIIRPDQTMELLPVGGKSTIEYQRTNQTGYYDFTDTSETVLQRHAINPSPSESDTTRILPASLDPRLTVVRHDSSASSEMESDSGERSFHRSLLLIALLLILVESGLACWFGQGRA